MTATQCIYVGQEDLLKFWLSIKMGNDGDVSDFSMVVGARGAGGIPESRLCDIPMFKGK